MLRPVLVFAGTVALAAAPAHAASTFDFATGPSGGTTATTLNFTSGDLGVTLSGYTFSNGLSPGALDTLNLNSSTFTAGAPISYSNRGVGICSAGETGGTSGNGAGCPEIDSADEQGHNATNYNEGLLLSFAGAPTVDLVGAVLNIVDSNDTLGIYGVALNGTLDFLGFAGETIVDPSYGFVVTQIGSNTNTEYEITFTPTLGSFSSYLFTTTTNGSTSTTGDGYRLHSLTVAAVPEPATWAMLLAGFAFAGFTIRRAKRRQILAVDPVFRSNPQMMPAVYWQAKQGEGA